MQFKIYNNIWWKQYEKKSNNIIIDDFINEFYDSKTIFNNKNFSPETKMNKIKDIINKDIFPFNSI